MYSMTRVNFRIFRASKLISNDTKLERISLQLRIKTPILNFCVGVFVECLIHVNFMRSFQF